MFLSRKIGVTAASLLMLTGIAGAQSNLAWVGSADVLLSDLDSGGAVATAEITGLTDIGYNFDGSDLTIPFTLEGTKSGSAKIWLIIYTTNQHPPLTITGSGPRPSETGVGGVDENYGEPGWHVYQNVDLLVYSSDGENFSSGANEIVWNGRDNNGDVVAPGSYDLFLAAFDEAANPHVVGYAPGRGGTGEMLIIDPDAGTLTRPYEWTLDMTNDFIGGELNVAQYIDRQAVHEAQEVADADATTFADLEAHGHVFWWDDTDRIHPFHIFDMTPLGTSGDITADMQTFVANGSNQGGGWLFTGTYDPTTQTVDVDTDWGADNGGVNGFIDYKELQGTRKYGVAVNPEQTHIYTTTGLDGTLGSIAQWDLATGENTAFWDVSEVFLYRGGTRTAGPGWTGRDYAGKSDPFGLSTSSHHTSAIASFEWDTGEVRWINRNGDGFGDMFVPATDERTEEQFTYGHPDGQGAKYGMNSTKWGWTAISHTANNTTDYGSMLGEDGSGMFIFRPQGMPLSTQYWTLPVDHDDSAWDGMYLSIGTSEVVGTKQNDWAPETFGPLDGHFLVHYPYDQKRVSLNESMTAVAELGGATPEEAELGDAYPNPFNPETTIRFNLPWEAPVKVEVFNDQGQLVTTLVNDLMGPGNFSVTWDGRDANGSEVASGVYIYKINSLDLKLSKKVTFIK